MNPALNINGKSSFPINGGASTSNQIKTPNCEEERSTSPVLSNTKKNSMRMAKYRSRKKLLGKFASSQESTASSLADSADLDTLAPLSPVLLNSQVSDNFDNNAGIVDQNDVKARYRRIKELQLQKKFRYEAVAKSSVNKCLGQEPDNSLKSNGNCGDGLVYVDLKSIENKVSTEKNPTPSSLTSDLCLKNEKCLINFKEQTQSNNSPVRNNTAKLDVTQTHITDTQMIQAAENAETILEVVDDQWTSSNKENSQNFNISSINFDSQWEVSPSKTQSGSQQTLNSKQTSNSPASNSQQTSNSQTSNPEEISENLSIPSLENVNTQWFFSPELKKPIPSSESSSEIGSFKCETVSVLSSQDLRLHISEDEDSRSTTSCLKKRDNNELKTFFGILSFSSDGITTLRQCTPAESNMQLRVKSNSWIFDVSLVNEDTLGFNSKFWKSYSKKYRMYIESFERHMFPDKVVEIEAKPQKPNSKTRKTRKNYVKKAKSTVAQPHRNSFKHRYNLRESNQLGGKNKNVVNLSLKENEEELIFKVPIGVPIKATSKSSIKTKDKVDYNSLEENLHRICGSPLKESTYVNSNPSNNGYKTSQEISDLLQKESESNYYNPSTDNPEETENNIKDRNAESPNKMEFKHEFTFTTTFTTVFGEEYNVSEKPLKTTSNVISEIDSNDVGPEGLDASDFNSPIEEEFDKSFEFTRNELKTTVPLNEEDFIENVDKILEEIGGKKCSASKETKSVNEVFLKLADVDLSSQIQKEFMEEFNTTFVSETQNSKTIRETDFATTSGGFKKDKLLDKMKRITSLPVDDKIEFMKQLNLNNVDKNNEDGSIEIAIESEDFDKIPTKPLRITKRRRSSNKGSDFVYNFGKKQKNVGEGSQTKKKQLLNDIKKSLNHVKKPTNTFEDLPENEATPSISKNAKQPDENISESFVEEVLVINELNEMTGNNSASTSTNVSNDLFDDEPEPSLSNKEQQLLEETKNISENSDKEVLLLVEQNEITGFRSVSTIKPLAEATNLLFYGINENEMKTSKEDQFLQVQDVSEVPDNSDFGFVSGKKLTFKSTNICNDVFENKSKTIESKKKEHILEEVNSMSESSPGRILPLSELNINTGFTFVSEEKQTTKSKDTFSSESSSSKFQDKPLLEKHENTASDSAEKHLPITSVENTGFSFVSEKKPAVKPTNLIKDIFENKTSAAKSRIEEQSPQGFKKLSEPTLQGFKKLSEPTPQGFKKLSEQLPQIEQADNSGKKPGFQRPNLFNDIFEDEPNTAQSEKNEPVLGEYKVLPDGSIKPLSEAEKKNSNFTFVSGKKPLIIKSTNIFKDIFENDTTTAKSKKEEQYLEELENRSEKLVPQIEKKNSNFKFVSGKEATFKPTNIFKDIFETDTITAKSKKEEQFLKGLKNKPPVERLPQIKDGNPGFSSVSSMKRTTKSTDIFKDIFESESKSTEEEIPDVVTNAESNEETLVQKHNYSEENNNKNSVVQSYISPVLGVRRPLNSPQIAGNSSTPISKRLKLGPSIRKRSLGSVAKSCRQLNLSENSAKKAKLIFEDFDVKPQDSTNTNNNNNNSSFSIATTSKHISSTPVGKETSASTSNTSISMKDPNETLVNIQKTTPVVVKSNTSLEKHIPSLYSFHEYETDDINQKSQLEKKYEQLKLEMEVFERRIQMLDQQEVFIKNSSPNHRKQRSGCLLCKKTKNPIKLALRDIKFEEVAGVDKSLLEITPQNALHFQFFVPWWTNDNRTYPAVIHTEDGAILIPNDRNSIGIHEIEQGFLAMPGVDPKLVPENWIRNHYKWIVWKLGSYERNFPTKFKGIMTVENVMAQLKYRYDREIDLAQRSALRRILEMDDSPAKRMVLCVSNIFKTQPHQNELELTDGWYSIKTLVDPVLNNLINTNKINIGLKLMIHGAELLNCEGCPPLETPANVRLQIHFNSTRRAAWHCKLGYQRNPGPLCVNLHSVRNQGGPVGLTTVYIARIYPVSFMEHGDKTTWRDLKAERRRENEWEAMQKDLIEQYLEKAKNELNAQKNERVKNRKRQNKISIKDVCKIQDACSLYELWEECNDPESLTELLTEEQCHILQNYQMQQKSKEHAELAERLRKKLAEKNITNRKVSSVLKLLVIDVDSLCHYRVLSIWRPNETHLQELKEGQCVNFYHLTVKDARSLSSCPRTCFAVNNHIDKSKFAKFERKVTPMNELKNGQVFDEFDTVGFVVEVNNEGDNKYMWIVDENKMFLLIRIRSTCQVVSIFDGLSSGKVVALQNLVHQKPTQNYATALGNCYTTLFIQPHQPYLQVRMLDFIRNLSENKEEFLEDCELLVSTYKSENNLKLNQLSASMVLDNINKNNSIGFESDVLTVSDEEMSLIDTQYF